MIERPNATELSSVLATGPDCELVLTFHKANNVKNFVDQATRKACEKRERVGTPPGRGRLAPTANAVTHQPGCTGVHHPAQPVNKNITFFLHGHYMDSI